MSELESGKILQKARQEKKRANIPKFGPSYVTLQVLGSGVRGTPSCLYVSTDHSKYLFNCGEGTQRLAHEHHLKLTKLDQIFFTTPSWKNMGGLPGMTLTIQDCGVSKINLHGPEGILDIFEAVKRFVFLADLKVHEADCGEDKVYEDTCMSVRYVHLKKADSDRDSDGDEPLPTDDTDYYAHETNYNNKRPALWQKPNPNPKPEMRRIVKKVSGCIAYICKLLPKLGTLNLEKCVEKGITPGPMLGQLKAGNDVTLEDGTVVKSSEVCDPPIPGPVFIVLECPDETYLDSLLNHKSFKNYQADAEEDNVAHCIIHFTSENILNHPKYIEWMNRFASSTEHLIINEKNNCWNYEALNRLQHQLHLIHPTIFPNLHDYQNDVKTKNSYKFNEVDRQKNLKVHRAKTLNAVHLRPLNGLDSKSVVNIDRNANIAEVRNKDGFEDTYAELQQQIQARNNFIAQSPEFPKILMLGTGSCIPNKVRNTSAILLRLDETTNVLLDCAEGTLGQLVRFYGQSEASRILANIKGIYLSHLHADHHLGLMGILQERKRFTDKAVFLIAPKQIESWLLLYHRKFEKIDDCYILVPNKGLLFDNKTLSVTAYNELKEAMGIQDISTCEVDHCLHAFGAAFTLKGGMKIVYSGDTKPCSNLVNLGQDCDLLIHEATMEDGLEKEAHKKMHSTVSEAIKISEDMNAQFTLLTHFSQRYSKIPRLPDNVDTSWSNVGIAFDNMQFSIAQLSLLPLFYPILQLMFSDFTDTLKAKAQKRIKREKRI